MADAYLSAFRHCRARAKKRYGMRLGINEYNLLCRAAAQAAVSIPKSNGDTYVELRHEGMLVKGVFDGKRLVTLLPSYAERPKARPTGEEG